MADKGPLLVTDGLTKLFDRARAVDNISLDIPAGQFVGAIGRSGAGKSTLLRLINRLTEPSAGRVLCDGIEVTVLRRRKPARGIVLASASTHCAASIR
jgi:phosphonate transport system ATP-binding protein